MSFFRNPNHALIPCALPLLLATGCDGTQPPVIEQPATSSVERASSPSCIDPPGFSFCEQDPEVIFNAMDAASEYRDAFHQDRVFRVREGVHDGVFGTCATPEDGGGYFGCSFYDFLADPAEATEFLVDLYNTPGSTGRELVRFEFRTYPGNAPTGVYGAYASRKLGPYACTARFAFIGDTWEVDVANTYAPECGAHLQKGQL